MEKMWGRRGRGGSERKERAEAEREDADAGRRKVEEERRWESEMECSHGWFFISCGPRLYGLLIVEDAIVKDH